MALDPVLATEAPQKGACLERQAQVWCQRLVTPTFRRYRQEDPESRANLGCYMRPCIKEGIQTLRLHPRPAANTGLYKDDVSCPPHKHNFTPGQNQGQHSWGEENRKGLKEGRKTVSPWRPWADFFFSYPCPCLGHITSTTSLQVCEGRMA